MVKNREAEMDHQSLRSPEIHEKFYACYFPRKHVLLQIVLGRKKGKIQNATDFLIFFYNTIGWFLLNMDF